MKVLQELASSDPDNQNCMNEHIDKIGWVNSFLISNIYLKPINNPQNVQKVFKYSQLTFFITTFLPCYAEDNSRFTFGVQECFILFQPELSFAFKDLPPDTPRTAWQNPKTSRDKIRAAFRDAGREYLIRNTTAYPMCYDMIKPLNINDPIVEWWK